MTRQLSSEFKRECAELVLNYGYAIKMQQKQVKQLQSDNQLLKKASAFFAMEMTSGNKSH